MPSDRSFYGGDAPTGGSGELTAGRYTGSEAASADRTPWKCPACGAQNIGAFSQGCPGCGSGKPGYHVGNPPPPERREDPAIGQQGPAAPTAMAIAFEHWLRLQQHDVNLRATENAGILKTAFFAGWVMANQHTMVATPPASADVKALAPEFKDYRTIIAALELFKDQILRLQPDEIASGEWCSIEETEALIKRLAEVLPQ